MKRIQWPEISDVEPHINLMVAFDSGQGHAGVGGMHMSGDCQSAVLRAWDRCIERPCFCRSFAVTLNAVGYAAEQARAASRRHPHYAPWLFPWWVCERSVRIQPPWSLLRDGIR